MTGTTVTGKHVGRVPPFPKVSREGVIVCPAHTGREASYVRAWWGEVIVCCTRCYRWATTPPPDPEPEPLAYAYAADEVPAWLMALDLEDAPDAESDPLDLELSAWLDGRLARA